MSPFCGLVKKHARGLVGEKADGVVGSHAWGASSLSRAAGHLSNQRDGADPAQAALGLRKRISRERKTPAISPRYLRAGVEAVNSADGIIHTPGPKTAGDGGTITS